MSEIFYSSFTNSLGKICLASTNKGLCWLTIDKSNRISSIPNFLEKQYRKIVKPAEDNHKEIKEQFEHYLNGNLTEFTCPIDFIEGTPFQQEVWREMCKIPYGQVVSYKEIAQSVGRPKAYRAVGHAVGANPIAIIVPCHRVISSDGSLCGYGLGLDLKKRLLILEGAL